MKSFDVQNNELKVCDDNWSKLCAPFISTRWMNRRHGQDVSSLSVILKTQRPLIFAQISSGVCHGTMTKSDRMMSSGRRSISLSSGGVFPRLTLLFYLTVASLFTVFAAGGQKNEAPSLLHLQSPCPLFEGSSHCQCFLADKGGLNFDCTSASLNDILAALSSSKGTIWGVNINDMLPEVRVLPDRMFMNGTVAELTIKGSSLEEVHDNAFEGATATRLHSLTIRSSKLSSVPRAVAKVSALKRLDLESNRIHDIYAYTFFGPSKLSYLNLKNNLLESMAENAFLGLENNLRELSLDENSFTAFPLSAVKILKKLQILSLSQNQVSSIEEGTWDSGFAVMDSLRHLDLSKNSLQRLGKDTFAAFPKVQKLLLRENLVQVLESGALDRQADLEYLDLSSNHLTVLPGDIFAKTRRLVRIDLSNNRLRSLIGVFSDLVALEEVHLNNNLLIRLSNNWFSNTPNLATIYLQNNVIIQIEEKALQPLKRLSKLYLSSNYLQSITANCFRYNVALTVLRLDNNYIRAVDNMAFRGVPKLRELHLQNNFLRKVTRDLLASLTSLSELHLQNNRISDIEAQSFSGLANLQHLDITGNR